MSRAQPRGRCKQKRSHGDKGNPAKPNTNSKSSNINGLLREKAESKETIKHNGEINAKTAIKTIITLTTTTTTVTKTEATTAIVKIEPGAGLEDTYNNNNNSKKNDINVEQNVTSVVNGKNEVKQEPQDDENLNININVKDNEIVDDRNDQVDNDHEDDGDDDDDGETLADELNGDIFKFEESDVPLPPLYLLKDEGSDKWVLLNDLCNLLKVKSKDTLLNKVKVLNKLNY